MKMESAEISNGISENTHNPSPDNISNSNEEAVENSIQSTSDSVGIIQPHSHLPKPEPPPGLSPESPPAPQGTENSIMHLPTIGKFIRERSNNFSAAIARKISSIKENIDEDAWSETATNKSDEVTQFNLSGLKVIVKLKNEDEDDNININGHDIKGRISFFSRSNCRDSTAVRTFFRQKRLKFVEINIDVYPKREKELIQRTGSSQVPQIFCNDKLFGGLVALNSLRNSGNFDQRFREMLGKKCSSDAPAPPVYGFDDDHDDESMDDLLDIIRVLRQKLPIQDRLMKMKIVKNCFAGSEMVEVLLHHLDCSRSKVRFKYF